MPRQEIFTLLSGLRVELKAMQVKDENKLASLKGKRKVARAFDTLLESCCMGVLDPGPYPDIDAGKPLNWQNVLQGDRFKAMIFLRSISASDGSRYEFNARCACGKRVDWEIDILKDLYEQRLPEESKVKLSSKEPFEVTVAGKKVHFHLSFGRDQHRLEKLMEQHPDQPSSCALETRIIDVEGIDRTKVLAWLDELTSGEAEELRAAFDAVDCGVDTDVEVECSDPSCQNTFVVTLPFEEFFMKRPSTRRRKQRESRTSASAP